MPNVIPLQVELDETVQRAVGLRAAKENISAAEVIESVLRKALTAEIEEVSGVPPLADMIQNHHDLQQGILRIPLASAQAPQRAFSP
jgi:hypothetical protein